MVGNPLIQLLLVGAALFGVLVMIAQKVPGGWWFVAILGTAAVLAAVVVYLLRFETGTAARIYALPGGRQFVDLVCKLAKEQPPLGTGGSRASSGANAKAGANGRKGNKEEEPDPAEGFELKTPGDFASAAEDLLYAVRGHEAGIRQVVSHVEQSLLLRLRTQKAEVLPPLGVFLLIGPPGVGKRFFATQFAAKLLTRQGILILDGAEFKEPAAGLASLFGTAQQAGKLIAAVRGNPQHAIIIERADEMSPRVLDEFRQVFGTGQCADEAGRPVHFRDTIFLLLTTRSCTAMESVAEKELSGEGRRAVIREALTSETNFDPAFIAHISEFAYFAKPDAWTKAEVVVSLMQRECQKYDVCLDYVEPEVIADEVGRISDGLGFDPVKPRVRQLLRGELADAARHQRRRVTVTAAMQAQVQPPNAGELNRMPDRELDREPERR